jgi:hypothetical protein
MSAQPGSCDREKPWFVGQEVASRPRPVIPQSTPAIRATPPPPPAPAVAPSLPAPVLTAPAKPASKPAGINWRTVGVLGGAAWCWIVGVIVVAWMAGGSTEAEERGPVAVAAPARAAAPVIEKPAPASETPAPVVELSAPKELVGPPPPTRDELEAMLREALKPELPPVAQIEEPVKKEGCGKCGTAINFMEDPIEAAGKALNQHKILFVVHVSGDFEDPGFT